LREKYGKLSGIVGICINISLFALKLAIGLFTNSIAITADAFNNLTDSISSILTIFGFKLSSKPADREHPFGHGRSEEIVSLIIAASIFILAYEFIRSSIDHILNPPELQFSWIAIALLLIAMLVKLWMFYFNRKLGRKINSSTLIAVAIDSRNDAVISALTIFSVLFTLAFGLVIDGFVGILVALMLVRSAYGLAKENLGTILGKPIEKATADQIKQIVLSVDGIIGVHDLIIHNYGPGRNLGSIHAEIPLDMPFNQSHVLGEAAEKAVLEQTGIHIIVRLDPVDVNDERLRKLKGHVLGFLAKAHTEANAHDFRMLDSEAGSSFIFELEIPYEYKKEEQLQLLAALEAIVGAVGADYTCVVNLEYGYIARE